MVNGDGINSQEMRADVGPAGHGIQEKPNFKRSIDHHKWPIHKKQWIFLVDHWLAMLSENFNADPETCSPTACNIFSYFFISDSVGFTAKPKAWCRPPPTTGPVLSCWW